MVQLNFDARQHQPLDNDVIPEGWYNFIIDESNATPTKDGNPNHLRLVLRASVIDGPHQGRKVFIGLNMRHTNVQTVEMANRELTALCHAVNLPYVQDSQQIHNIPFKGRVKIRKDPDGRYDDQAEIKSYKPINFVPPGSLNGPSPAPQQQVAPPPATPQGWGQQPQQAAPPQAAPNNWAPAPQQPPQTPSNGAWQQPQQPQPWGQPQPQMQAPQTAPPPPQQTQLPPVQYAAEPTPPPPQQQPPVGFAAPPPPQQQAPQAPPPPPTPEVQAAQNAVPPWARTNQT